MDTQTKQEVMQDVLTHITPSTQDFYRDADGNLHGEYRRYYKDGTLELVAHYCHGRREGISEDYDEDGNLTESYLWHEHCIMKVLHDVPNTEANEMIGFEYPFMGR
jgi:hypothetical protein